MDIVDALSIRLRVSPSCARPIPTLGTQANSLLRQAWVEGGKEFLGGIRCVGIVQTCTRRREAKTTHLNFMSAVDSPSRQS